MSIILQLSSTQIPKTRRRLHSLLLYQLSTIGAKLWGKEIRRQTSIRPMSVLCLALCLLFWNCAQKTDQASNPPPGTPVRDFPDTPVGNMVNNHVGTLVAVGEDAEAKYQASLQQLRSQIPEVVKVIHEAYLKMDTSRYFRRWALVETLRELHSDSTLPILIQIASSLIPPEKWSDPETSSRDKESHIRVTAVEGIADLAQRGNRSAEQALARFFNHEDLSVRRQAIRGYLSSGQDFRERADYLQKTLPEKDHWLINLDLTNVKRVPHPDIPEDLSAGEAKKRASTPRIKQ